MKAEQPRRYGGVQQSARGVSGWTAARWWLLARGLAFGVFAAFETHFANNVSRDVSYFGQGLHSMAGHGLAHTLVEYPVPAVLMMLVPWLMARVVVLPHSFVVLFAVTALAIDAAFTRALVRRRAHLSATATWLVGAPLLGALSYFRFDLVPAVLVGFAILTLAARPRLAQVVVALATVIKLWPALVIAPVAAAARHRWGALGVMAGVGGAFAIISVALAGWSRLISPLTYQAHRGLHIESVWATPAMLGWGFGPSRWRVFLSPYMALEVVGYHVPALVVGSTLSAVVLAVALVVLWARLLRHHGAVTAEQVAWVSLAGVTGFVVTGKVLSPQYLLWLLTIVVAGLAVSNGARAFRIWAAVLLVALALTHGYVPEAYLGLVHHRGYTAYAVVALVVRNLLLLWLLGSALVHAWRATTLHHRAPGSVTTTAV